MHTTKVEPKVIYHFRPDKALIIAVLLEFHLWDAMTPEERRRACDLGECLDTAPGRALMELIETA
jgi:hypothetical protein